MKIFLHRIVHCRRTEGNNLAVHTTGIVTFIDFRNQVNPKIKQIRLDARRQQRRTLWLLWTSLHNPERHHNL